MCFVPFQSAWIKSSVVIMASVYKKQIFVMAMTTVEIEATRQRNAVSSKKTPYQSIDS